MAKIDNIILERKDKEQFDWLTVVLVFLLVAVGLISIYSATYESKMSAFFYKQIAAAGIGTVGMFVIAFIPKRILKQAAIPLYVISILLLTAVLFFGVATYGTKGWLPIGGFTLQPAELSKFGFLMIIALHLSTKGSNARNVRDLAIALLLLAVPVGLIIMQPDFGTSTVLMVAAIGILFWAGLDGFFVFFLFSVPVIIITALKENTYFFIALTILSILSIFFKRKIWQTGIVIAIFVGIGFASPIIYDNMMPHQQARINTFLNPGSDPQGTGYNVIQSIMAVGSGGLTGKGYLQGTQTQLKYIPMQWTDFIYSVPNEEFGFVGGTIIILLYSIFLYRAVRLASNINDKFYSLLIIGAVCIFVYHCLINIGMAIGLMPVMGIPLPFMSYGGTSMVINLGLVGLILNAYREYSKQTISYS